MHTQSRRLLLAFLFLFAAAALRAQAPGTGAIAGRVISADGAPVTVAKVSILDEATQVAKTASVDAHGDFSFPLLLPGTYSVKAEAAGFNAGSLAGVRVVVAETSELRFRLTIADVRTSVQVDSEAEIAQTASATLGRAVGAEAVNELPLSNRNFTQILSLSPGVNVGLPDATVIGRGTQNVSDAGNKPTQNNIQFNGIDANNLAQNSAKNANEEVGVAVPAPDTIQEFKVQTANYDASYGRGTGANVDLISRAGSGHLHGDVWEFVRNNLFNANDFFNKANGQPRPELKQNQFGAAAGGPLLPGGRTFFFGAYQGLRSVNGEGTSQTAFLPQLTNDRSAHTLGAQFCPNAPGRVPDGYTTLAGGTQVACDGSNINPVALKLLNFKLPNGQYAIPNPQKLLPTTDPTQLPIGSSTFSPPAYYNEDQYTANIDRVLSSRDQLAARFFYSKAPTISGFSPSGADVPGWGSNELDKNLMFVLASTHTFTPTLINVARFGYMRFNGSVVVTNPISTTDIGIESPVGASGPAIAAPAIALDGLFSIGDAGTPQQSQLTNSFIWQDIISLTHNRHNLRFGGEVKRHQVMVNAPYSTTGYLDVHTFDDLLVGQSAAQNGSPYGFSNLLLSDGSSGDFRRDERYTDIAAFVQDDLRLTARLTINAGLRYEIFGAPTEAHGHFSTFDPATASLSAPSAGTLSGYLVPSNYPAAVPSGVKKTSYAGLWPNEYHDVSPRLGFAYQLTNSPTLVLRGGYGIYFGRISGNQVEELVTQPPFSSSSFVLLAANGGASLQHPFVPLMPQPSAYPIFPLRIPGAGPTISAVSPNSTDPYTQEYNLNLQTAFARDYLVEVGYLGNRSLHEVGCNNFNQALLASPSHPINGETANTSANVSARVPWQGVEPSSLLCETAYSGNYNGLTTSLTRRPAHGLQFLASYTWSKSLDNTSGSGGSDFYEGSLVTNDQHNPRQAYGLANMDRSYRAVLSLVYQSPRVRSMHAFANALLSSWTLSGIAVAQSGTPLTILDSTAGTVYGNYSFEARAQAPTRNPATSGSTFSRVNHYLDASAFPDPPEAPFGQSPADTDFGNSSTGFLRGPHQRNIDAAIERALPFGELGALHLRAEFFNLTNTTQFGNPDTNLRDATFGVISSKAANPRIIQFAAKYSF